MKNNFFFKKEFSNIYKKPSASSEVISQILYGEKFKILSKNKKWLKIKTIFDNYIGFIEDKNYTDFFKPTHKVFSIKTKIIDKSNNKKKYLPFASKISIIQESNHFFEYEKDKWVKKKM